MKYTRTRNQIVLDKGTIKGFEYFILSLGSHPTAYVKIPKDHKYYKLGYDDIPIDCHGGLTFASTDFSFNPMDIKDSWWVGWDYAHSGDWYDSTISLPGDIDRKKWTTEEILKEVKKVINQLVKK